MAQEVITGSAVLYGIRNNGSAITIEGYASFLLESMKAAHKFKLDAVEDELGFDAALIATNAHIELDITFIPKGASRSAAEAVAIFLPPLSRVAIANCAVDGANSDSVKVFNGNYIYVGDASIDLSHGPGKMSMKVRKYDDATQNTSLTTTV